MSKVKASSVEPEPSGRMCIKGIISALFGATAMFLVFFVFKDQLSYVKEVPSDLIYMSIIGVLIYVGMVAAGHTQTADYKPLKFVPEYVLRVAEAPVFLTVAYTLILEQNKALNQTGTLLALSLFIGLFTRDFEEFLKVIGQSILKPLEDHMEDIKTKAKTK